MPTTCSSPKIARELTMPCPKSYAVSVGQKRFSIPGLLYCQQNQLNKACAHVALRSLLTRMLPEGDIAHSRMNMIAAQGHGQHAPSDGLTPQQMRRILTTCGVTFSDVDYEQEEKKNPTARPNATCPPHCEAVGWELLAGPRTGTSTSRSAGRCCRRSGSCCGASAPTRPPA